MSNKIFRETFRVFAGRWSNGEGGFDNFNFDGCTGATAYEAVLEAFICDGMDIGAAADRISFGAIAIEGGAL